VTRFAVGAERALVLVVGLVAAVAVAGNPFVRRSCVASEAGNGHVQADQRKVREVVIEGDVGAPLLHAVALRAVGSESARVHVAGAVTCDAVRAELLLRNHGRVARVAVELRMPTHQLEMSVPGMVEAGRLPGIGSVALVAGVTEAASVSVCRTMAAGTVPGQWILEIGRRVTGLAVQVGVPADQWEARFLRMIEARRLPARGTVTACAVGPATAAMDVVGRMTGRALRRCSLVTIARMACRAGRQRVLVAQREAGPAVIESCASPAGRLVAIAAVRAKPALVWLGRTGAVHAARLRFPAFLAAYVAGVAVNRCMSALQFEVGARVIECGPRELHDIGVPPEVFRVAGLALRLVDLRQATVETAPGSDIGTHVLVAVHAQRALARAVRTVMALRAVLLELGVRGTDLPRHQQGLERGGLCVRAADGSHHHDHHGETCAHMSHPQVALSTRARR